MTHALGGTEVSVTDETSEKARRAVKAFRTLQPTLSAYARVLTGRNDVQVVMASGSNGSTDGKRIFFRPPIALGDTTSHNRSLCDKRDEDLRLLCDACRVRESVLVPIYHEIAHIAFDTFGKPSNSDLHTLIREATTGLEPELAARVAKRLDDVSIYESYMALAKQFNQFLPALLNALEDARINAAQFKARKGTKLMFDADVKRVFAEGVEQKNAAGEIVKISWKEYPQNSQILVGIFCKASGYDYHDWFIEPVVKALDDPDLTRLVNQMSTIRSAKGVYELSFPVLRRVRELGFCVDPETDIPSDQPSEEESSEETGGSGSDQQESESDSSGDSDNESEPENSGARSDGDGEPSDRSSDEQSEDSESDEGSSSDDGDSEGSPSDPRGDRVDEPSDESASPDGDTQDSDEDSSEDSFSSGSGSSGDTSEDDSSDSGEDDSDEMGNASGGSSESSEGGSEPGTEEDEVDESSEGSSEDTRPAEASDDGQGDSDGESGESSTGLDGSKGDGPEGSTEEYGVDSDDNLDVSEGEVSDTSDSDDLSDGLGDEPGGSSNGSMESSDSDGDPSTSESSDDELASVPEDAPRSSEEQAEPEPDEPIDSGADEGHGGTLVHEHESWDDVPMGDADDAERAVKQWSHHGDKPENIQEQERREQSAVDKAVIQGLYFETPSRNIYGVREHYYGSPVIVDSINMSNAWRDVSTYARAFGKTGEYDNTPESILGGVLLKMRVAFSANKRGTNERHRKAGKIDPSALGKRAWNNDPRLFRQKRLPGKRDYFVLIGLDVSGSTLGVNIDLIKRAAFAQATLLSRMGIKFAIYAHSGNLHAPSEGRKYGLDLDIYHVKDADEPWDAKVQERLTELGPSAANLDGHSLEYYRNRLDERPETDKILLYFSDGKMPAENHDEELQILQREIKVCRQKGYHLLGVGIRTDSPARHGLDTVQIDNVADLKKVVDQLGKYLSVATS